MKNYNFVTHDLEIDLKGDSEARLTVNGIIDLDASGDSSLYYKGRGKIEQQQVTGDSVVKRMD